MIDVGGTTSDVGALVGGFPREASLAVEVGGVRTNFRMPDLLTLGLGGGSLVRPATPARRPPSARTASATGSRSGRSSSAAPT